MLTKSCPFLKQNRYEIFSINIENTRHIAHSLFLNSYFIQIFISSLFVKDVMKICHTNMYITEKIYSQKEICLKGGDWSKRKQFFVYFDFVT